MRRLACAHLALVCPRRALVVGPSGTIPQPTSVPQFGKHAKAVVANKAAALTAKILFSPEAEAQAKTVCEDKYDFIEKPLCLDTWMDFQRELQRLELQWTLAPGPGGVFNLKFFDHAEQGDGLLCDVNGSGSLCTPIADFFDGCGQITQGATFSHDIRFADGKDVTLLRLEAKHSLSAPNAPPLGRDVMSLPQYNCRGTQVSMALIDERTGLCTPLFHNLALQTLNYHFLTSLPLFLKRSDIGVRNSDFVSKQQMQHFRFAWCFLRRESWMTPIEMGELDNLLPL